MLRPNWPSSSVKVVMTESAALQKCFFRMLVTMYETTLCNIPEEWNLNIYYCENLKSDITSHTVWKDRTSPVQEVKRANPHCHCKVTKQKIPHHAQNIIIYISVPVLKLAIWDLFLAGVLIIFHSPFCHEELLGANQVNQSIKCKFTSFPSMYSITLSKYRTHFFYSNMSIFFIGKTITTSLFILKQWIKQNLWITNIQQTGIFFNRF
jgi:hypothetical protein